MKVPGAAGEEAETGRCGGRGDFDQCRSEERAPAGQQGNRSLLDFGVVPLPPPFPIRGDSKWVPLIEYPPDRSVLDF